MISQMKALEDENRRLKKMYAENAVARHGVSIAFDHCPRTNGGNGLTLPHLWRE
jgi:hypothetical protein